MKTLSFYQQTKVIAVFLAIFLCGTFSHAQDITGQWNGVLSVQGVNLRIVFHISKTGDGYTSTMDSPDQGATGIPVTTTKFDGSKLSLAIANLGVLYEGELKTNSVVGTFKQGGMSLPMTLERTPAEVKPPVRPQESKPSNSSQTKSKEEEIVLNVADFKVYGTLKVPGTKGKVPVVLFIAGSGPTDRNCNQPQMTCNTFKMLSDSLNHHGIATLSYDKRGIAKSANKQKEEDLRFEDYVEDAKSWIELLSQDNRFSEIIVLGHSEGSLIGMIACANHPKVSKFISIAGIGSPADEILKEQLSKRLEGQPITLKNQIFTYIDELKQGRLLENVPLDLYALFRPSVQPYMISWFKYHPQKEIAKLKIPILILQGNLDIQVSENEAKLLHQANPNAKKVIINNMNHVLKNSQSTDMNEQLKDSYNNPDTPVNRELVENIVVFVK